MLSAVTCGQMPPPSRDPSEMSSRSPARSPAASPAATTEERSEPPQKIFSNLVSKAMVSSKHGHRK